MSGSPLRLAVGAMGTRFELVLAEGRENLTAAGESAIDEIETWHRRLTRFAADSLVSHINREASRGPVRLDRDTFELLRDAQAVWRNSGGAFDITVASSAATSTGASALRLDPDNWTIEFTRPGVSIDLGGIGKGHALDCAARVLRAAGVTSALLHAGTSSIVAIGACEGYDGWRVGVPAETGRRIIALRDAAISVSDAGGAVEARRDTPHIVDPRNGQPVMPSVRATVVGPSARLADAWSTALVVLGSASAALPAEYSSFIDVYDTAPA